MMRVTLENNSANKSGGALHAADSDCKVDLEDVVFKKNKAKTGGALAVVNSAILSMPTNASTSLFKRNSAFQGGGVFCDRCGKRPLPFAV